MRSRVLIVAAVFMFMVTGCGEGNEGKVTAADSVTVENDTSADKSLEYPDSSPPDKNGRGDRWRFAATSSCNESYISCRCPC